MAAAAVVAISMAFVPASADTREETTAAVAGQATVLAAAETPQEAVWDMTYGAERPMAIVEVAEPFADANPVTDLSMG
jgi:hypothetical protein